MHGCEEKGRDEAPLLQQSQRIGRIIVMFEWLNLASANSGGLRLRLVTSRGVPYPSRSPRAHPSGWTRTKGRLLVSCRTLARLLPHVPAFLRRQPNALLRVTQG